MMRTIGPTDRSVSIDLRQLKTFQVVARWLNFSRAAEELDYAQSTVSAQINALEEDLSVRLFDRLGRRVLLTEAGQRLLPYAEKILSLADQTHADVGGTQEPTGHLTMRIPESLGIYRLPPVIKKFHADYPGVRLEYAHCTHEGLGEDLRKGITDLAFLVTDSFQADDLYTEELGTEPLVVVANPAHRLATKATVQARDLEGETVLLSRVECDYRRTFKRILDEAKVRLGSQFEFTCVEAIKRCVIAGTGLTIIPTIAVHEEIERQQLVALPWAEGGLEPIRLMIWHKEKWLSPTLRAFMQTIRETLATTVTG
jgi:DNA-binding transcriptional LysR family regulator